jgi:hypothetical protein
MRPSQRPRPAGAQTDNGVERGQGPLKLSGQTKFDLARVLFVSIFQSELLNGSVLQKYLRNPVGLAPTEEGVNQSS